MNKTVSDTNVPGSARKCTTNLPAHGIISVGDFNGMVGTCRECGSQVADYNGELIASRPEAETWDWWLSCTNPECKRHHGEGVFQDSLEWVIPIPIDQKLTEA